MAQERSSYATLTSTVDQDVREILTSKEGQHRAG